MEIDPCLRNARGNAICDGAWTHVLSWSQIPMRYHSSFSLTILKERRKSVSNPIPKEKSSSGLRAIQVHSQTP